MCCTAILLLNFFSCVHLVLLPSLPTLFFLILLISSYLNHHPNVLLVCFRVFAPHPRLHLPSLYACVCVMYHFLCIRRNFVSLPSFPPTFLGPDLLSGSSQTCMPFPPQQIFSCIIAPSVSSSALKTRLLPSSYILRCSIPPVIFFFPSSTSCLLLVFSFFLFLFSCHHILLCDTRFLVPLPFCALHLYTRMS